MKINIIGGGPAGLYFALLMKAHDPKHEISIYERSPADQTWGWGVVFSDKTLGNLQGSDAVLHQRLQKKLVNWNDVVILYQGQELRVRGNPFSSIARIEILKSLQERCEELGVRLHFETHIESPDAYRDCDLLVGADGINSVVRQAYAEHYRPQIDVGRNKFIWLGTHHLFNGLTLGFAESNAGAFACHAYRFCENTSTFIAECSEETWQAAGLDSMSEDQSLAYVADVFKEELGGQALMSNRSSWIHFRRVKNENWFHENTVLLGDALHTAHFSIGSGTKLAMEDSIVLAQCLGMAKQNSQLQLALQRFEKERRPAVEKLQGAAETSRIWFEEMQSKMGPSPALFAFDCMTRSGRIDMEKLRAQDPEFVRRYEEELSAQK